MCVNGHTIMNSIHHRSYLELLGEIRPIDLLRFCQLIEGLQQIIRHIFLHSGDVIHRDG